ncbi:MAG: flavodoxin family protein [Sphaerochaetaceae bacterium]|nr:flavodoxin family protein [Sphaerochaetaceae bacterium]
MRNLIFTGSNYLNSNCSQIVKFLFSNLSSNSKIIDPYKIKVNPCTGCNSCLKNNKCIFNDDMDLVVEDIQESDRLIFISPVFFFGLPSALKTIIDRFQIFWEKPPIGKEKHALVILTGGSPYFLDQFYSSKKIFNSAFKVLGINKFEFITLSNTDKVCFSENYEFKELLKKKILD